MPSRTAKPATVAARGPLRLQEFFTPAHLRSYLSDGLQVPALVQSKAGPGGGGTSYSTYVLALPNPSQAGNCIIVCGQYGVNASTKLKVTDNLGQTYLVAKTGTSGDTNQTCFIAYFPDTAAGVTTITIAYNSSAAAFCQNWAGEFNNVAPVNPVDASSSNTGTAGGITAGSITPGGPGDLLVMMAEQDGTATTTAWTAGSQSNITWQFAQNDQGYNSTNMVCQMVQWGVYNSEAAINPAATLSPANQWNTVVVAFKASAQPQGSPAPATGVYVSAVANYNVVALATNGQIPLPGAGNLGVLTSINSSTGGTITSITGSVSGSWTRLVQEPASGGSGIMEIWYAPNATLGAGDVLTIAINGSAWIEADICVYAIQGAAAAPWDVGFGASGIANTTGNNTVSNSNVVGPAGTPSTPNGVLIAHLGVNSPQITGLVTGISDTDYSPQEASVSEMCENNGKGHYYNPNTSSFTFTWTAASSGGVGTWQATAVAFMAIQPIVVSDPPEQWWPNPPIAPNGMFDTSSADFSSSQVPPAPVALQEDGDFQRSTDYRVAIDDGAEASSAPPAPFVLQEDYDHSHWCDRIFVLDDSTESSALPLAATPASQDDLVEAVRSFDRVFGYQEEDWAQKQITVVVITPTAADEVFEARSYDWRAVFDDSTESSALPLAATPVSQDDLAESARSFDRMFGYWQEEDWSQKQITAIVVTPTAADEAFEARSCDWRVTVDDSTESSAAPHAPVVLQENGDFERWMDTRVIFDEGSWSSTAPPAPFAIQDEIGDVLRDIRGLSGLIVLDELVCAPIVTRLGPTTLASMSAAIRPAIDSEGAAVRPAIDSQGAAVRPAIDSQGAAVRPS